MTLRPPLEKHQEATRHASHTLTAPSRWLGVDENGLGPCMGPLCVTLIEGRVESMTQADNVTTLGKRLNLTDSKVICGYGKMRWAESVSLALLERTWGSLPVDLAELDRRFRETTWALQAQGPAVQTQRPCPSPRQAQLCWSERVTLPAFGGDPALAHPALDALEKAGFSFVIARQQVLCSAELNVLKANGHSRLAATLLAVESLLAERLDTIVSECRLPAVAHCGLIGGIRNYSKHVSAHLMGRLQHAAKDENGVSYSVEPHHTVYFGRAQDDRSLPTALASVVGKYTRELWMQAINHTLIRQKCTQRPVSGYQDPYSKLAAAAALNNANAFAPPALCVIRR